MRSVLATLEVVLRRARGERVVGGQDSGGLSDGLSVGGGKGGQGRKIIRSGGRICGQAGAVL